VGYQCVDCVHEGRRSAPRRPVTVAGAALGRRLVVVHVLIGLNLLVYLLTVVQAGSVVSNANAPLFADWALWPPAVAGGQVWRLATSGFLHYGPLHLAFNMYALWVIGRDLELVLGRLRFTAVYVVSLFGGGVSVFLLGAPQQQVAGASGAVFGLMGGIAVAALRLRLNPGPALGVIALNVVISVTLPGISLLGHLGGLVVGALATAGMVYAPVRNRTAWQVGTVVGLAVLLVVLTVLRYQQFGGAG
jgi:membrane associated rhomboid family serine protease